MSDKSSVSEYSNYKTDSGKGVSIVSAAMLPKADRIVSGDSDERNKTKEGCLQREVN